MRRPLSVALAAAVLLAPAGAEAGRVRPVPTVRTPTDPASLAAILRDSHFAVHGTWPSRRRLTTALAQVLFENGRGREIYCNNLGFVGGPGPHFLFRRGFRFRAHADLIDGGRAYWRALRPAVLPYFDAGDAMGAAAQLSRSGYHRTDPEDYGRQMRALTGAAWRAVEQL